MGLFMHLDMYEPTLWTIAVEGTPEHTLMLHVSPYRTDTCLAVTMACHRMQPHILIGGFGWVKQELCVDSAKARPL